MQKFRIGSRKNLFGLLLLLTVGAGLRTNAAMNQSLWRDEVSVFKRSMMRAEDLLFLRYQDKSHPQLYYLFLHFWQKFETSPIYLRIPSLIASSLTLVLIYSIGRLVLNHRFGLLSSLFFAVNPFLVNLGYQVKFYSFEMLFVTASLFSFLIYIRTKRLSWAVSGAFFNAIAFYTDYSSLWYFGSLLLTAVIGTKFLGEKFYPSIKKLLLICLLTIILMSAGLNQMTSNIPTIIELESIRPKVQFGKIEFTLKEFAGFAGFSNYTFTYILFFICSVFLFKNIREKTIQGFFSLFILIAGIVPLFISYGFSQISPIFLSRNVWNSGYFFIFGPALALTVLRRGLLTYLISSVYVLFLIIISTERLHYFKGKTDWKSFSKSTAAYGQVRKMLVFLDYEGPYWWRIGPLRDYYLAGYDIDFNIDNYELLTVSVSDPDLENKLTPLAGKQAVWLLYSGEFLDGREDERKQHFETIEMAQALLNCGEKPCKDVQYILD